MFDFLLDQEERPNDESDEEDTLLLYDGQPGPAVGGSNALQNLQTLDGDAAGFGDEEVRVRQGSRAGARRAAGREDSGSESEEIDTEAILQHLDEEERDGGEFGPSSEEEEEEDDDAMDIDEDASWTCRTGAAFAPFLLTRNVPSKPVTPQRGASGMAAGPSSAKGRKAPADYNTLRQQRTAAGGKRGRGRKSAKAQDRSAAQEFEELLTKTGTLVTRRRRQGRANAHRKKSAMRRGQAMSDEVSAKLGEANLLYTAGRFQEAQLLLREVIRLAPNVADSYQTMALIHEALDQPQKALDFMLIAAHMGSKSDAEPWRRLAAQSVELKNLRQAIYCLSRVCKFDLNDVDARWDRAVLLSEIGDVRKAALAFEGLRKMRPDDVEVVKNLARVYHQMQNPEQSTEVVETFIRTYPHLCDLTLVNILAELYLSNGRFEDTVQLVENTKATLCAGDAQLPLDLIAKSAISLLSLGQPERAAEVVSTLRGASAEEYFDLFRDVAEAYWAQGDARSALELLLPLRAVEACDAPPLWERIAACRVRLGDVAGAVSEYESVLTQHPGHPEALTALAKLLPELGRSDEAQRIVASLEEVANSETDAAKAAELKLKAASLRLAGGNIGAFLSLAVQPVTQSLAALAAAAKAAEAVGIRKTGGGHKRRVPKPSVGGAEGVFRGFVTRVHPSKRHHPAPVAPVIVEHPVVPTLITDPHNLKLVIQVCRALVGLGRFDEAAAVAAAAMPFLKGRLCGTPLSLELHWLAASIADRREDRVGAAKAARVVINHRPWDIAPWNLFARTTAQVGLTRFAPFIGKTVLKFPTCLPAVLLQAHTLSVQGAWGPSLSRLLAAFRMAPNEPLVCLSAGVALLHHGMSRKVSDRLKALLAAVAFLQRYASLRGMNQEAAYNLGRAFHQLGLPHLAMSYYERALREPPEGEAGGRFDLRRETAHNLALLYVNSGAPALARKVLRKFAAV